MLLGSSQQAESLALSILQSNTIGLLPRLVVNVKQGAGQIGRRYSLTEISAGSVWLTQAVPGIPPTTLGPFVPQPTVRSAGVARYCLRGATTSAFGTPHPPGSDSASPGSFTTS